MPEISIIVPVYKVEKYLKKCVDSILAQTFTDFELILVDDGSPDNCGEICDEYAKKDPRIRVLHKKNGGHSDARNAGLDAVRGNFIGFVDSDDFIAPDMYEFLYKSLMEHSADIVCCGHFNCFSDRQESAFPLLEAPLILNSDEASLALIKADYTTDCLWNKLYTVKIFNGIRFPLGRIYEDAYVTPQLFERATRVVINTDPKYYYLRREGSIIYTDFSPADLFTEELYKNRYDRVLERFPDQKSFLEFRLIHQAYIGMLERFILSQNPEPADADKELIRKIRKNTWEILKNPNFTTNRKIMTALLRVSPKLYRKITRKRAASERKLHT